MSDNMQDYVEYEKKVIDLLKKRIEIENSGNVIKTHFYYRRCGSDGIETDYVFDLVELNQEGNILKVYEICSRSAYRRNRNSIQKKLLVYETITNANVYLVYMVSSDSGRLCVIPLSEIKTKSVSLNPKTIESFSEFYSIIEKTCDNKEGDLQFFFRGQSNKRHIPIPSIYRDGNIEKEDSIYHEAIRRNQTEFTEDMSAFDNLVKMQHYELPTRLLDITTNPLVALYFACLESIDKINKIDKKDKEERVEADGKVLVYSMLQNQIKYYDSDSVCALANLAKRPMTFNFNDEKDHLYLVNDIEKDKPTFNKDMNWSVAIHQVLCVLPKLNNDRIIKQNGAFFIFGMGETKDVPASLPDQPTVIVVKANAKKKILRELELLGINEAFLFPETDKIMKQIKQQFCPTPHIINDNQ